MFNCYIELIKGNSKSNTTHQVSSNCPRRFLSSWLSAFMLFLSCSWRARYSRFRRSYSTLILASSIVRVLFFSARVLFSCSRRDMVYKKSQDEDSRTHSNYMKKHCLIYSMHDPAKGIILFQTCMYKQITLSYLQHVHVCSVACKTESESRAYLHM